MLMEDLVQLTWDCVCVLGDEIRAKCGFGRKCASGFSASSTAEEVTQGIDGTGLTAIVTVTGLVNNRIPNRGYESAESWLAWTTIETREAALKDFTSCNGQFYAINAPGEIYVCDVGGCDPTGAHVVGRISDFILSGEGTGEGLRRAYIVELEGELLIVIRKLYQCGPLAYRTRSFAAFKVDLIRSGWKELKSLGDNALILGSDASISVPASKFKGVRPNCIYYTDEFLIECITVPALKRAWWKDLGIYNLEDQTPCALPEPGVF
ncbi:hypothetical protein RHMOL_Rhmol02G0286500 [Rhododendron molle]|uniref:Uncharacterized protein n=1 Tax=Rhododendron molle TaxID=49168 RepID=A0ACC0PWK2_RHOML|nr:hypothetical protein RHMOL_Rhmol02G0286500 [Rhododendron molle]